jgi:hypothetical protein
MNIDASKFDEIDRLYRGRSGMFSKIRKADRKFFLKYQEFL